LVNISKQAILNSHDTITTNPLEQPADINNSIVGRFNLATRLSIRTTPLSIPKMTACHIPTIPDQINE
jgi:hypothetical protein